MTKKRKNAETIEEVAARGCTAFEDQTELSNDPADDAAWNKLSLICRLSLKKLSTMPAKNKNDILAKARVLAMAIDEDGEGDQRFALAESILEDLEELGALSGGDQEV